MPELSSASCIKSEPMFMESATPQQMLAADPSLMLPPVNPPFLLSTQSSGFLDPSSLATGSSTLNFELPGEFCGGDMGKDDSLTRCHVDRTDDIAAMDPSQESNLLFPSNWESFDHVFGWGLDNSIDLDMGLPHSMFDGSGVGPVSSTDTLSAAWLLCTTPRQGSPVNGVEPMDSPSKALKQVKPRPDPFGRNDDNPWVNLFIARLSSPETCC